MAVADQKQTEGHLALPAIATEQTDFLQRGGAEVLSLFQGQDGPEAFQLLPGLTDFLEIVAAAQAGSAAQLDTEQAEQIGAGDRGVGDEDGFEPFVGERA